MDILLGLGAGVLLLIVLAVVVLWWALPMLIIAQETKREQGQVNVLWLIATIIGGWIVVLIWFLFGRTASP